MGESAVCLTGVVSEEGNEVNGKIAKVSGEMHGGTLVRWARQGTTTSRRYNDVQLEPSLT